MYRVTMQQVLSFLFLKLEKKMDRKEKKDEFKINLFIHIYT